MTLQTEINRWSYAADGVADDFDYERKITSASDLSVYLISGAGVEYLQTLGVDYSLSGVGANAGGTVTFMTPPANGYTVLIYCSAPYTQPTDLLNAGRFLPESHQNAFDRLAGLIQQLNDRLKRTFRFNIRDEEVSDARLSDALGKFPYIDADGELTFVSGDPSQPVTHEVHIVNPANGATVITVPVAYTPGSYNLSVYLNGVKLVIGDDYTESSTTTITLTTPATGGDVIEFDVGTIYDVTLAQSSREEQSFTGLTTPTLTLTTVSYTPNTNSLDVYMNGVRLAPSQYTETNTTTITLAFTPISTDEFIVVVGRVMDVTTVSRNNVGLALYPITTAEIAAGVTPSDYAYAPGDVRRYGAVGDGVTDDTVSIQNAFDSNNKITFDPNASYTIGHIDITQNFEVFAGNASFALDGDSAGFFANGTITYGRWYGGRITGDGVNRDTDTSTCQVGISIGNDAGANVSNVIIYDPVIDQANIGIRVAYGTSPNDPVDHAVIVNPRITGSVGYVGGAGYGILMSQVPGGRVQGGCISGCQRHGMYFSEGERYIASDVEVYDCGKGDGTVRGAVCVSRSGLVTLTNLSVHDNGDVGMTVDVDSQGIAPKTLTEVNIVGGVWKDNDYGDITIGTLESPATGGLPHNVKITGAQLTMPSAPGGASIVVHHCDRLDIHETTIDATAVASGSARLIVFDAVGGATYTDRISVKRNTFRGGGGGTIYGIQVPAALAVGNSKIDLRDNDFDAVDSDFEFLGGEDAVTNNNLLYNRAVGGGGRRTYSSAGTGISIAVGGLELLTLSASGATTVGEFTGGVEGQTIVCYFTNGNTTMLVSYFYLAGAVNFVGTANDTLTLRYINGQWREVSRSIN